jgi:hypothetical protein
MRQGRKCIHGGPNEALDLGQGPEAYRADAGVMDGEETIDFLICHTIQISTAANRSA